MLSAMLSCFFFEHVFPMFSFCSICLFYLFIIFDIFFYVELFALWKVMKQVSTHPPRIFSFSFYSPPPGFFSFHLIVEVCLSLLLPNFRKKLHNLPPPDFCSFFCELAPTWFCWDAGKADWFSGNTRNPAHISYTVWRHPCTRLCSDTCVHHRHPA
jgi:hypothetical protein